MHYLWNVYGIVILREYDPYKRIVLNGVMYTNGILSYIMAVDNVNVGDRVSCGYYIRLLKGSTSYLMKFKAGIFINSLELLRNMGSKYCRSSGTFAKLVSKKYEGRILIKLHKTRKYLFLNPFCIATLGVLLKTKFRRFAFCKAGYNRRLGWRPVTRGYAMNPVDHPHGGRTKSGIQVSMWGKHTKGWKSKKKKVSLYEVKVKR